MQYCNYDHEPRRDILCIDCKSFFASVEAVRLGIHPLQSYIGVMSNQESQGGLILAAAPLVKREYGIKTGSRRFEIPTDSKIQLVAPRMQLYLDTNQAINDDYRDFVSEQDIHVYSVDETFLDVTASRQLFGSPEIIAQKIQERIWNNHGIVVTVGIGDNPLLAKLALDNAAKSSPPYIATWRYEDVPDTIWQIKPMTEMWGIGRRTAEALNQIGIFSIKDLAQSDPKMMKRLFGKLGQQLFFHAHGIDRSMLRERVVVKSQSYGKSQVLMHDYVDQQQIEIIIREMADQVAMRLRKHHVQTQVIHLGIGFSKDIIPSGFAHQQKSPPTSSSREIIDICIRLFRNHYDGQPVRTIAISCGKIIGEGVLQFNLFQPAEQTLDDHLLYRTVDRVRDRYGYPALIYANSLIKGATAVQRAGLVGGHKA